MKTFEFVCAEHPEYGSNGWRLKSQPDFDPLGGMAVAHDCLEHFTDSAEPADEFLALGASMYVRDESYYAHHGKVETSPGVHVASDLPDIMRHVTVEGYGLPPAPKTKRTDYHLENYIDRMYQEYRRNIREEYDKHDLRLSTETQRSIRSYLRIGYRRAERKYGGRRYEAQSLFCHIEEEADKYLKHAEEGAVLKIRVDFRNLTAKVRFEEYPEDDY